MGIEKGIFNRTQLLLGSEAMERIANARVIVFGVGGVGSWCAESLVRSGIRKITIVDSDRVCITNINRQLMATTKTVGQVKVEALKERLLTINPSAEIDARQQIFCEETAESFQLDSYDYIIDAIDSLKDKMLLIEMACRTKARFYSSMGAALKLDPTKIKVAEFWQVQGCPLARALRQRFKKQKRRPARKFQCVYSDELLENKGHNATCGSEKCMCPKATKGPGDAALLNHEWCSSKAQINGSLMHITAIFGMTIAGLVIKHLTAEP
ncbi:MAG: tRNA threonylcarbamoyladenosine dehydratase [Prevotellaceae bacterium]|nr:tRNA threonylcarbamoyladenosine dehydratase [Prevotellaceae bacterium]